ncbi:MULTISPECIES: Zn-ribbon domain-containing OB-fold protein [Salipiger]|uniref:Zn-ribbon domain-containing OB-fold protein n=1 Tax=Salipiger TaxID=263377 RepID=UPI0035176AC2
MGNAPFDTVVRCEACGQPRAYPRPLCPACHSPDTVPFTPSGRGTVYTFTEVHRAPSPAFGEEVPYTIALIDLEEGLRLPGRLTGCGAPRCGARVELDASPDGYPVFRLLPEDGQP